MYKHNKKNMLSLAVMIIFVAVIFCIISYRFIANDIIFTSVSLEANPQTVEIGETFDIVSSIGTASSEISKTSSFTMFLDNPNIELINFTDGHYHATLPSGEVVEYTAQYTSEGIYVTTNELTNGDTVQLKLSAVFNENTTKNNEVVNITISSNNESLASTSVTAHSDIEWNDEKTGPLSIKLIDKDNIYMSGDYTYTIKQYPSESNNIKDTNISTIKMSDTIVLPQGMTFSSTDNASIIKALGLESISGKNLNIQASNNSVTFTWEESNDGSIKEYNFKLDNDSFVFDDNFISSPLTNDLNTTLVSELGSEYPLETKKVITNFEITTPENFITNFKKELCSTNVYTIGLDNSWGYITQGDIVVYKISFTNKSDETLDYDLVDMLPDELSLISKDEIYDSKYPNIIGDSKNSEFSTEGNKITWHLKNIKPDEKVEAYIQCKSNINTDSNIINKAYLEDKEASITIKNKKKTDIATIEKTADYNGTMSGKEFTYTIKISNNNNSILKDRKIVDEIPSHLNIISATVDYCNSFSNSGKITIKNNTVTIDNISLGKNSYITYKIRVAIDENYDGESFKNVAKLYKDYEEEGSSTFNNTDSNVTITKTVNKSQLRPNDKFQYKITINNNLSNNIDYTKKPMIFRDNISDLFIVNDAYYTINSKKTSIDIKNNEIYFEYKDVLKSYSKIEVIVNCTVKENPTAEKVTNTAYWGEDSSSVDVEIINESNKLDIEKTAYHSNEVKIEDGMVDKEEIVKFRLKISNLSDKLPVSMLSISDDMTGDYRHFNHNTGKLGFKVIDKKNVTGFVDNGTILYKSNMWTETIQWTDCYFRLSANENYKDDLYYNENFSIEPNGYIILEYELKIGSNFNVGDNEVILNDEYKDSVELSALKPPIIDVEKNTDIHNFSIKEIDTIEIPYTITITNKSQSDDYFSEFEITDTLPDGLMFCNRWWGNPNPWINVDYVGGAWIEGKGGHYYDYIDGNTLHVIFGSIADDGTQTPLKFKSGETITITVKCKFTEEKIKELKENYENIYPYASFTNNVLLTSKNEFKDYDGNFVKELTSEETINIIPEVPHPGINKEFVGAFSGLYNGKLTNVPSAGDSIVWTITVTNTSNDGPCGILKDFIVEDIMPSDYLYDSSFNNKMYLITGEDESEISYIEPENIDGKLTWNFDNITLEKNQSLKIELCLKNDGSNKYSTIKNISRLITNETIEKNAVSSGELIDDYTIEDSAETFALIYKTSSYKTISYEPCGNHRNDPPAQIGYGYLASPQNKIQGKQCEPVYYKLYLKNESSTSLKNIYFIDKLPYINDIGVVSGYDRNSAFAVNYGEFVSAIVYDKNGNMKDISSSVKIDFSNTTNLFSDSAKDWIGENDVGTWHEDFNQDVNIRFYLEDISLSSLDYVEITFTGLIPEYVSKTGEDNVAWNNFGYSYNNDDIEKIMVAEPAKVGVWVSDNSASGEIIINKEYISEKNENTFYFALFKKDGENLTRYSSIESVTVNGNSSNKLSFTNLPPDKYYVYEVDSEGNILDLKTIIGQGQEVVLENDSKEILVQNIGKKASLKIFKHASNDNTLPLEGAVFELSNNTYSYQAITDKDGIAIFENLDFGEYTLTEIKSPKGYRLLDSNYSINISTENIDNNYTYNLSIDNIKEIYMPSTGSIGPYIFIYFGLFIISIIFIIFIVAKKSKI